MVRGIVGVAARRGKLLPNSGGKRYESPFAGEMA
jgi:hypothetical protein